MAQAMLKKRVYVEFITFDDFIQYGKEHSDNLSENGIPWSFTYNQTPVTHENDEAYVILTVDGTLLFTPKDVLITNTRGTFPCRIDVFEEAYEVVEL
jgi:hypothetical protein